MRGRVASVIRGRNFGACREKFFSSCRVWMPRLPRGLDQGRDTGGVALFDRRVALNEKLDHRNVVVLSGNKKWRRLHLEIPAVYVCPNRNQKLCGFQLFEFDRKVKGRPKLGIKSFNMFPVFNFLLELFELSVFCSRMNGYITAASFRGLGGFSGIGGSIALGIVISDLVYPVQSGVCCKVPGLLQDKIRRA